MKTFIAFPILAALGLNAIAAALLLRVHDHRGEAGLAIAIALLALATFIWIVFSTRARRRAHLEKFLERSRAAYLADYGQTREGRRFLENPKRTWDQSSTAFGSFLSISQLNPVPVVLGLVMDSFRSVVAEAKQSIKPKMQAAAEAEINEALMAWASIVRGNDLHLIILIAGVGPFLIFAWACLQV